MITMTTTNTECHPSSVTVPVISTTSYKGSCSIITMTTTNTECPSSTSGLTVTVSLILLVLLVIAGIIIIILVLVVIRLYNKIQLLRYICY